MKKIIGIVALGLLSLNAFAADIKVNMLNTGADKQMMVFEPSFVKAKVGDTITFVSKEKGAHNTASLLVPKDAKTWQSKPDTDFTVKVEKEGVYLYACEPHKMMGMVGVIQVGKAGNLKEAQDLAKAESAKMSMNKDRFEKALKEVK
jgi:pseudoazurin